jgi:hypothetical protein
MPIKGKAASTSNDDVKYNTRALTSISIEEPINSQLIDIIRAEFT